VTNEGRIIDTQATSLRAGEIFNRLGPILRANALAAAGIVFALTVLNVALDAVSTGTSATFFASIMSLVAQYYLTVVALERSGAREPGASNRFLGFWGMNILSGLGILLGFVLLVVPGLYLSARWAAASPALLAGDEPATASLGESWRLTEQSVWAIMGVQLVIFVPVLVVAMGLAFIFGEMLPEWGISLILYPALFGAFAVSWLTSVTIYTQLRPNDVGLAEVFA
jgi:hypothetical protein